MRSATTRTLLAAALLAAFGSAQAVVLPPGSTQPLPGTTAAAEPQLAGVVEVDELVPFSFATPGGDIFGNVQVRVVRSSVDDTIDFYWRVFNDRESASAVGSFRIGEFYPTTYDANWRIDGLGDVAPLSATRFDGAFLGYVNFNFSDLLSPGTSSHFFFLDTDAHSYAKTAIYDLTNFGQTHISGLFSTYAPVYANVPEPGTAALMLAAGGVFGFVGRRKRQRAS